MSEVAVPSEDEARAFALSLGRALHAAGYPAHRLEEALGEVCHRLALAGQFFSTPTALFASFGTGAGQRTYHLRIEPGGVDLGRVASLDAVRSAVAHGARSPTEGLDEIRRIDEAPPAYPAWLDTLCFAVASAAAARFFGGGAPEVGAGAAIGLLIGFIARLSSGSAALERLFEPVAAAVAGFVAALAAVHLGPLSTYVATLADLIVLVPGYTLTVAIAELAMRHLVSGTARFAGAAVTFLAIGFGAAAGGTLGARLFGTAPAVMPKPLPEWTLLVALLLAPLAFTVLLRAAPRDAPAVLVAGVMAFAAARGGAVLLGPGLGAFVGAVAVTVFGNAFNRPTRRPPLVPVVPGILLLVPGSVGFRSLSSLMTHDTVLGLEAAFEMVLIAISLAMGLLFANALLPPRPFAAEARPA